MNNFVLPTAEKWVKIIRQLKFVRESDREKLYRNFTLVLDEMAKHPPTSTEEAITRVKSMLSVGRGLDIPSFLTDEFYVELQQKRDRTFICETALQVFKGEPLSEEQMEYVGRILLREAERGKPLSRSARSRGRDSRAHEFRDRMICMTVGYLVGCTLDLNATRNETTGGPSACSIVSDILKQVGAPLTEKRVAEIWARRSKIDLASNIETLSEVLRTKRKFSSARQVR